MEPRVRHVIEKLEAFMPTVQDALPLPRAAAEFIHALVWASGATLALEIGTSYGYSGLWIASALAARKGRLITIDSNSKKTTAARINFAEAGLAERVDVRHGDALDVLRTLDEPIDFVLNDADKGRCVTYVEQLLPVLRRGAVLVTDNTATHEEELAEFLSWIRHSRDFFSTNVPIGNGMEMSVFAAGAIG